MGCRQSKPPQAIADWLDSHTLWPFPPAKGGSEAILVVDDDDDVRTTAAETLSDLGYSVLKDNNAESAMAVLENGVTVDVLFTDVVMPCKIRSTELACRAKQHTTGRLFTSGYTDNAMLCGKILDHGRTS